MPNALFKIRIFLVHSHAQWTAIEILRKNMLFALIIVHLIWALFSSSSRAKLTTTTAHKYDDDDNDDNNREKNENSKKSVCTTIDVQRWMNNINN